MVYKMMQSYAKACSHILECIEKAKLGLLVYSALDLEFLLAHVYEEWQQVDDTKAVIAQLSYQNVLEKLQDEGEEDCNEDVNEWLVSGATWQKYAKKCEMCGDFGFAVDLYMTAFARCKSSRMESAMWFGLANAQYHVGKKFDAIISMENVVKFGKENVDAGVILVLERWKKEQNVFNLELKQGLEVLMETYLIVNEGGERDLAMARMKNEMVNKVQPHIMKIKANITRISREHYAETEIKQMETGSGKHLAKMGSLCFNENGNGIRLMKCACILMQKAVEDTGFEGNGEFYRKLAVSHFKIWQMSGSNAEVNKAEKGKGTGMGKERKTTNPNLNEFQHAANSPPVRSKHA